MGRAWMASHQPRPSNPLQDSRERLADINQRLPEQFSRLPLTPLVITSAPDMQGYRPPVLALKKPAFYFIANNANHADLLQHWPSALYQQTLPGRHLQTALPLENPALPHFLSTPGFATPAAGWPLLGADLATRLGGYRSNEEQAGIFISELDIQLNLLLDTATHALGWDNERRLTTCLTHSALNQDDCQQRLHIIEANPGDQASAAISLSRLRKLHADAKAQAGSGFTEQVFYSDLLSQGTLPAELYGTWLEQWLDAGL